MKLAAIFVIFFAVCGANAQRPAWYMGVDVKFQRATPFYAQYYSFDLAHVVSWSDIEAIVDAWDAARRGPKRRRWDLTEFVRYLTAVDTEACVYNPLNPTVCILHNTILNANGGVLRNLNTDIRRDVLAEIASTRPDLDLIKRRLNSAPANLRYGTGRFNRQIQGWVDPMGDTTKELTTKEKSLIYATDAKCNNYRAFNILNGPFLAYANYFQNVILVRVNANNIHLRGTHYDPDPSRTTALGRQFEPTNPPNTIKLYVLSSSQAGDCPLGTLRGDQNRRGDTIKYYVKNV
jgi:hypothetical protein